MRSKQKDAEISRRYKSPGINRRPFRGITAGIEITALQAVKNVAERRNDGRNYCLADELSWKSSKFLLRIANIRKFLLPHIEISISRQ